MPGGYAGKLLFVDLSSGRIWDEPLDEKMGKDFIGGYGLGARILFSRVRPHVDPLGPDNMLGMTTGPFTGTPALFGSRFTVVGKSPLTDTWGDANCGGRFGPYLKYGGYDAVFFSGIAEKPVYLLIDDGKAELKDASGLWGKDAIVTEDTLGVEYGKESQVACIGTASEKLSLITGVCNDRGRLAARSGLGAVMGSKRLKAVVARGNFKIPIANRSKVNEARKTYLAQLHASPRYDWFRTYGTAGSPASASASGDSPVANWAGVGNLDFPTAAKISDESVKVKREKKYGCFQCPMACGGHMMAGSDYRYLAGVHQPEYETLAAFGTMNLVDDVEAIVLANDMCNRYGFDTISAGATISFAIECFENGIITLKDTDGIELRWRNAKGMVDMLEKMGRREGFGDVLADGVKKAAQRIGRGSERFAVHIQGQEPGMHDPKFGPHWGTAYQYDATPGRHTQGSEGILPQGLLDSMVGPNLAAQAAPAPGAGGESGRPQRPPLPTYFTRTEYGGRGDAHKVASHYGHVMNSAGMCLFGSITMHANYVPEMLSAVTGWDVTLKDVLETGERIANLRHGFNLREGLNPRNFYVHGRTLGKPPMNAGPHEGIEVDINTMAKEYLAAMGWDQATTKPSRKRLEELGLKDVADALNA